MIKKRRLVAIHAPEKIQVRTQAAAALHLARAAAARQDPRARALAPALRLEAPREGAHAAASQKRDQHHMVLCYHQDVIQKEQRRVILVRLKAMHRQEAAPIQDRT
jgi:hypothetical protein